MLIRTTALSILAMATAHSASAQTIYETQGRVSYLAYFGNGGPRSGETIIASNDAPGRGCGSQDRFTARIGYPATDTPPLKATCVSMRSCLMRMCIRRGLGCFTFAVRICRKSSVSCDPDRQWKTAKAAPCGPGRINFAR
jgi:hypothetical protein